MKWRWTQEELAASWYMSESELSFLGRRTGLNRLALAVLLKFFQNEGMFPASIRSIPTDILKHLAEQVGVEFEEMTHYDWAGRTAKRQRSEVLNFLVIRRFQTNDRENMKQWLKDEILPLGLLLTQIKDHAGEWFRIQRLEPLSEATLERLLRSETRQFEITLLERVSSALSKDTEESLEQLLNTAESSAELGFSDLKSDPGRSSLKSILDEIAKLQRINGLNLPPTPWRSDRVAAKSAS